MSEISGVFLIQKMYIRSLRKKLKKNKYDYVIISTTNEKWVYFVLDEKNVEEVKKEEDFDEYFEQHMENIDWDISLTPKTLMEFRNFSKSFPILFIEYTEGSGWGYVFFVLGEIRASFFLDYDIEEPSIQEIKQQLRMVNIRELRLLGLKKTEINEIRELLDKKIILQDIKGELEIPLVVKFLKILGINDITRISWNSIGYINDLEFLRNQRRLISRPLRKHGFKSYKKSDIGRICDGTILQYIEFQKNGEEEGEYYVNVWIRPLFSDLKGIGGRITLFAQVPTHGGEYWSEETKTDLKLVRDGIMEFVLPWFEQHAAPRDLINHFENNKNKKMENWTHYDIAMVYLWIQDYEKGAYYLKMAQNQVSDENSPIIKSSCENILSLIESGQFEKIQSHLEKNLKKGKRGLKKLQKNIVSSFFRDTFRTLENEEESESKENSIAP